LQDVCHAANRRARALGNDAALPLAEGGGEDDDKGLTHMVMDGGVEANAVGAGDDMWIHVKLYADINKSDCAGKGK
jgi:hypothetical protein